MDGLNNILELHSMAVASASDYPRKRFSFQQIAEDSGKHFLGIVGLRGSGKSIILKQLAAARPEAVYIPVDNIQQSDLFEMIKILSEQHQKKLFLLDEVHFLANIDEILKKVYDFLNVKIIFTSSVSLGMYRSAFDLSRRVKLLKLLPFSFREYLYFHHQVELQKLTLEEITEKRWLPEHLAYGFEFERFLRGGNMPFSLDEPDILPLLKNILQTIIRKDIPQTAKLHVQELDLIEKTVTFIGRSEVDGINYSSISRNVGITKYKAQSYLELLQSAFVLHRIMPAGTNVLKEPKIILAPPFRLLFRQYEECVGPLREDFFVEMLSAANLDYSYLKSTRGQKTPDYLIQDGDDRVVAEVGGKGKGREQFKGIKDRKQIIFSHSDIIDGLKRPLQLAGFLA